MSAGTADLPKYRLLQLLVILLFIYFCFYYRLGKRALTDPDEGRYAEGAREMLEQKQWVTPLFNYEPRLEKPALFYWFVALSYKVFGVNEWAARFFPACFAAGGVALTYLLASQLFSPATAFLSALLLCTTIIYLALARLVITDMLLALCILGSLVAFAMYYFQGKKRLVWAVYICMGLGVMTKGPVGLIIPGLIILGFLLLCGEARRIKELRPVPGLGIILVIVLPWLILLTLQQKGILKYYLLHETFQRFFTAELERQQPIYYYPLITVGGALPWSLFVFPAFISFIKGGIKKAITEQPVLMFCWLWVLVPLVFFSLSQSKLPTYINPIFPAVAIITAGWTEENIFSSSQRKVCIPILLIIIIFVVVLAIGIGWIKHNYDYYNGTAILLLGLMLAFAVFALLLALWNRLKSAFVMLLSGLFLFIILSLPIVDEFVSQVRSTRALCSQVQTILKPQDDIIYFESDTKPSSVFYLRRRIPYVEEEEVHEYLNPEQRLIVLLRPRHYNDLLEFVTQSPRVIFDTGGIWVVTVEKD